MYEDIIELLIFCASLPIAIITIAFGSEYFTFGDEEANYQLEEQRTLDKLTTVKSAKKSARQPRYDRPRNREDAIANKFELDEIHSKINLYDVDYDIDYEEDVEASKRVKLRVELLKILDRVVRYRDEWTISCGTGIFIISALAVHYASYNADKFIADSSFLSHSYTMALLLSNPLLILLWYLSFRRASSLFDHHLQKRRYE